MPAPARWMEWICPSALMMEASVEPAPMSRMARGLLVPGVVRAADGHVGLHAAHLDRDADLLGKFPGDGLHLEAVRLDHGGDAHGVLLGKLVGQAALNLLGCECVDRQQILNLDVPGVLAGQIRHDLAHLLQHAAGVGSRLSPHILQAGNGLHGPHDLVGPVVHIHLDAAVFSHQLDRSSRNFPLLHVSGRGLDHHRRAVSNQGRAMGTTCRVSSEDRPNRVAMP